MGEDWVQPDSPLWIGKPWAFKNAPFFHSHSVSLLHTRTHTPWQQGNSTNPHWRGTKGNQSLLVNDAKRYDKKYVISLSERISLHTHLYKRTISHTHTHHKVLDVTLICLGRVWPTAVILCMVARNAGFDIQLLCAFHFTEINHGRFLWFLALTVKRHTHTHNHSHTPLKGKIYYSEILAKAFKFMLYCI